MGLLNFLGIHKTEKKQERAPAFGWCNSCKTTFCSGMEDHLINSKSCTRFQLAHSYHYRKHKASPFLLKDEDRANIIKSILFE